MFEMLVFFDVVFFLSHERRRLKSVKMIIVDCYKQNEINRLNDRQYGIENPQCAGWMNNINFSEFPCGRNLRLIVEVSLYYL